MYDFLFSISNTVGILGVSSILLAYFMLSMGKWIANSVQYHFCNFIGAWMILFSLMFHWNLASVIIEIAWIMISMVGFYRVLSNRVKNASV